jgi:predicted RNA binding protein YcfA (HicA-like mRNA interferase family)
LYLAGVLGRDLVQLLKQNGWTIDHVRGSHYILSKGGQHLSVPVHAGKELGKGLLHELLKKAGLK